MATSPTDPGPYSAVIDYDQLAQEEEAKKQRLQAAQQKIMRTNAIGDAFRILAESAGALKGASVLPRPVNPGILNAANKYNQIEQQSDVRQDQYRNAAASLRMKDAQRNEENSDWAQRFAIQQKAEDERIKQNQEFQAGQAEKNREWQNQKQKESFENSKALETHRTNENIRQASETLEEKQKVLGLSGTRDRSKALKKDDILFQIPGTTQKIYIGKEEAEEMAHYLVKKYKEAGQFIMDPTLRAIDQNQRVQPTSLVETLKQNWDVVKYALPEYADQRPPEPTAQEKRQQEYDTKRQNIEHNKDLSRRKKDAAIHALNEQYIDVTESPQEKTARKQDLINKSNQILTTNAPRELRVQAMAKLIVTGNPSVNPEQAMKMAADAVDQYDAQSVK